MNILFKLLSVSLLFPTSFLSGQVALSFGQTSVLQQNIQSDTSFINSTYNKGAGTFASTFTTAGLKFDLVANPTTFQLNASTPMSVTLVSANYASSNVYNIGYSISTSANLCDGSTTVGSTNPTMWNGISNSHMPWLGNSGTLSIVNGTPSVSVSFFSSVQGSTSYQSNTLGWTFYNVSGTNMYMAFMEVGPDPTGIDFNDGVLLLQGGQAIPEPKTYALCLGLLTLGLVGYRRVTV